MKKLLVLSLMTMILCGCKGNILQRNLGDDIQRLQDKKVAYEVTSKNLSQGGVIRVLVTEEGEVNIYNTDGLFIKSVKSPQ